MHRRSFLFRLLPGFLVPRESAGKGDGAIAGTDDTIRSLVDTLVPADGSPGALDIGIGEVMVGAARGRGRMAGAIELCVDTAERLAVDGYGEPFSSLGQEMRESIFLAMMGHRDRIPLEGWQPEPRLRASAAVLRNAVIGRYYLDPVGQASAGYQAPWPAGYRSRDLG